MRIPPAHCTRGSMMTAQASSALAFQETRAMGSNRRAL
jgi:hypothetical protein